MTLPVDEKIHKATNTLAENMSDEINLINVLPPEQSEGMEIGKEFLEAVHFYDYKNRLLRSNKNDSPVCGMEVWYEDNTVKFMFYTPDKDIEKEYRQQLTGYYPECEITQQTDNEGMFIETESDKTETISVIQFQLKEHYFLPLANPNSEDNELDSDPFKRIINEIDTKDDTRLMIQYLYQPAPYNWTEGNYDDLEVKAKKIQNKGGFKTRFGGFKIDEVDDPGIYETAASEMRSRLNQSSYYLNIRLAVICSGETEEKAERKTKMRVKSVVNTLEHLYTTKAGQKLVPKKYRFNKESKTKKLLVDMIERNPTHMKRPRHFYDVYWQRITPNYDTMILTTGELAGHIHLPSPDDVNTGAIKFKSDMVSGEVPPDVDDFEPVSKEERTGYTDEELRNLSEETEQEEYNSDSDDSNPSTLFDNEGD